MATPNKYITVAYELYTAGSDGKKEMVEKATAQHPFQFISGLGTTLEAFEAQIKDLNKGDKFDFSIPVKDAYEERDEERVIEVSKDIFKIDGKFDDENIIAGNIVPLTNADGDRFNGLVAEVKENAVILDLNHPLAGKDLTFVGEVVESRDATNEEIQSLLNALSGEGGCGGGCEGCGGGCNHEGECDGHGEGHCEGHGEGHCEGHHHDHEGGCCGHHK